MAEEDNRQQRPSGQDGERLENNQERERSNSASQRSGTSRSLRDSGKSGAPSQESISRDQKPLHAEERTFDLLVDSVPYMVKAKPFRYNDEMRYRVSYNGSPEHVFTWDAEMSQLRAIDDEASLLPDNLEQAISDRLQSTGQ
jgi:hypothetical protein